MIDRLIELQLTAFRAFGGEVTLPLDADVVLVHGANGRGKSSLLAAIELAISGQVADLARFDDDYPRCLCHLPADGSAVEPTRVELAIHDGAGELRLRRRIALREGKKRGLHLVADGDEPSAAARRYFVERAYLSQRRLGRLLDLYQAPDPANKEQPLVRVLRELLGLDPLAHLSFGLHATQNLGWLRPRSPAWRRLIAEEAHLQRDRDGWSQRLAARRDELRRRLAELRALLPMFATLIPETLGGETPEAIDLATPTGVFEGMVSSVETVRAGAAEVDRWLGQLEILTRLLDSASGDDAGPMRQEAEQALAELAKALGLETGGEATSNGLEKVADTLDRKAEHWRVAAREARRQEETRLRAGLLLERSLAARRRVVDALAQEAAFDQRASALQAVRETMEGVVASALDVRKAALDVQQRFVDPVFDQQLNRLWSDLFRRLASAEAFRPELSELEAVRGQLKATTRAVTGSGDAGFEQLGSILSSGNLNTAALTLFIALHFLEEPAAKVLVIDDPVQAMDDVHTVQLAALLRAIARGPAPRQLILAVHERALFDYLRLELGPTIEGASLLAVEVEREPGAPRSIVRWQRDTWKPDRVDFG